MLECADRARCDGPVHALAALVGSELGRGHVARGDQRHLWPELSAKGRRRQGQPSTRPPADWQHPSSRDSRPWKRASAANKGRHAFCWGPIARTRNYTQAMGVAPLSSPRCVERKAISKHDCHHRHISVKWNRANTHFDHSVQCSEKTANGQFFRRVFFLARPDISPPSTTSWQVCDPVGCTPRMPVTSTSDALWCPLKMPFL